MMGYIMLFVEKLAKGEKITFKDIFIAAAKEDIKKAIKDFGRY